MNPGLYILLLLFACSCSYNRFDEPESDPVTLPLPNMPLGTLRALYPGYPVEVSGREIVLSGHVNTSDEASNFYRSFIVEDGSGAVEVRAGLYDLYHRYAPGQQVVIAANGLTLGMENGVLQLGLASDRYPTDYMDHRTVIERYVYRGEELRKVHPRLAEPRELRPEWCGTLVRIDGLSLAVEADTTWALPAPMTATGVPRSASLKFRTSPRDSVYVLTSGYAAFAGERVPRGRVSVQGILMLGEVGGREVYQLKMRDRNDVQKFAD